MKQLCKESRQAIFRLEASAKGNLGGFPVFFLRLKQIENIRSDEINDFKVKNLLSKN